MERISMAPDITPLLTSAIVSPFPRAAVGPVASRSRASWRARPLSKTACQDRPCRLLSCAIRRTGGYMRSGFCYSAVLLAALATVAVPAWPATLILVDGRIWTENPKQPEAEAIAIDGNRIVAVGSSAEIRKLATAGVRIVDLGGRRVVPGFNDAHVHFLSGGDALACVQLREAGSADEFRRRIGDYAKALPKGAW